MATNDQIMAISAKLERVYNAIVKLNNNYVIMQNEQKKSNELLEINNILTAIQLGIISKDELKKTDIVENSIKKSLKRRF